MTDLRRPLELLRGEPTHRPLGLAATRTGRPPGEAPPLLLLHGVGSARTAWATVLERLEERYDVVVLDMPGHGLSPAGPAGEDHRPRALAGVVAQACRELGLERPHVMGNSLGGWIGLEMCADGTAASLTALCPAGLRLVPGRPSPVLALNRMMARVTAPVADPLVASSLVRRLTFASGSERAGDLDVGLAREIARALREATLYESFIAATGHHRFERRADVTVPVTVVFGDRDRILPAPANQRREVAPAHARWEVVPRCGHAPMWDAPELTLRLLEETVAAAQAAA